MTTSPADGCAICADRVEVWRDDQPDLPEPELAAVNERVRELMPQ